MNSSRNIYIAVVEDDESVCRSTRWNFLHWKEHPLAAGGEVLGGKVLQRSGDLGILGHTVVIITARGDAGVREQAAASGCAGYFRKTDPGELVLEAITKAVNPGSLQSRNQAANQPG